MAVKLYEFRYAWDRPDAPKRRGVIAQDLIARGYGDCVAKLPGSGLLLVHYDRLRMRLDAERLQVMARRANLE